ncbi:hypothetical protein HAX54_045135, partial [Datura stramonium]|nr:hypothetical protein [Datura stramonium]
IVNWEWEVAEDVERQKEKVWSQKQAKQGNQIDTNNMFAVLNGQEEGEREEERQPTEEKQEPNQNEGLGKRTKEVVIWTSKIQGKVELKDNSPNPLSIIVHEGGKNEVPDLLELNERQQQQSQEHEEDEDMEPNINNAIQTRDLSPR